MNKLPENDRKGGQLAMHTPPIVSPRAWEAAREQLLVKEKAQTRARDALAAERRRMPWTRAPPRAKLDRSQTSPLVTCIASKSRCMSAVVVP